MGKPRGPARLKPRAAAPRDRSAQLRQSEARFRALTELSSDWYWEQDGQFRFTRLAGPGAGANAAGGDPTIYIGKARWEIPDLDPLDGGWADHRAQLERHEPFRDAVLRRQMDDGRIRYMAISGEPVFDAGNRFTGYRGIGRDITERKRAEDDLRRFRLAMDSSADMIVLVDRATMTFVDANSTICRLLGYTREELLAKRPEELLPVSRAELEAAYDRQIANPSVPGGLNSYYRCKDGSKLPFESKRQVLRANDKWLISVVSRDIRERVKAENAQRESEERFRSLTELSSDFYWETDSLHRIVRTRHGSGHRSVNVPGSQTGKTRWDIASIGPDAAGWAAHRAVLDAHQPFRGFEFSRLDANGAERHLSISGEPVFDEHRVFTGYRGVGQDITTRKLAEDELRSAVSLLSATLESTADGILVVAADHSIARFNQRFVDMWRIPAEIIGSRDDNRALGFVLDQVKDAPAFIAKVEDLYAHPADESFDTIEFKDGRMFERYSRPQYVANRPVGRVWSFRDVTDRKRAEERIHVLAFQDALTELPNRVLFRDRFEQATARADRARTKVALLFLDLDNFKTINDSLGHAVGDALLRMVASRLRQCVRDTDTISRQGGDEFLIMLADLPDAEAATPVAQKLQEQFQVPFAIEGNELTTSVSVGISFCPDDGEDFDTLLKKADTAMYRAKEAGRNTYRFFDAHMNVEAVEHLSMRNGLRTAVGRGELVLHYQPQVDLNSGEIVGAEALVRWNHPQHGLVLPGRFIPIAEESGSIVQIGEWVLREATRQAAAWRTAGWTGVVVAANLSAVQFTRGGLEKAVINALEESGIEPSMLELELTESILVRDTETTLATVKRLKTLGVKLSIDDFGTGYSSLSYLKRFEVDKLKIDQSFIRDLTIDPEDAAIVRSIIQMARSLGLRTIAEGVEDEALLHYLRIYHCDEAQGYHFGRPMPAEDFAGYLSRHPKRSFRDRLSRTFGGRRQ